jgi:hypothetical protein
MWLRAAPKYFYFVLGPALGTGSDLRLPDMTLIENTWCTRRGSE